MSERAGLPAFAPCSLRGDFVLDVARDVRALSVFRSRSEMSVRRCRQVNKHRKQLRQIVCHDLPHDVLVDSEVVVHDLVSHPDDLRPRNFRMRLAEGPGDVARRLADHLDKMGER